MSEGDEYDTVESQWYSYGQGRRESLRVVLAGRRVEKNIEMF